VGRVHARDSAVENGMPAKRIKIHDLIGGGQYLPGRVGRESLLSGFDEGLELDLAVDDFDDVLDIAAILLLL